MGAENSEEQQLFSIPTKNEFPLPFISQDKGHRNSWFGMEIPYWDEKHTKLNRDNVFEGTYVLATYEL